MTIELDDTDNNKPEQPEVEEQRSTIDGLRGKVNEQHSEISALRKEIGTREQLNHEILEQINYLDPYLQRYIPKRGRPMVSSPIVATVQFGDWHIGEVTDKSITGDFGEYNYAIAQDRIFRITNAILGWIKHHRTSYKVHDCQIIDEGDNISGDIHRELTVTNEFTVPGQIIKAAYLKAEVIRRLASHFRSLTVDFVVPDNHSRRTIKPQSKQAGENSENYLVGFITQTMLANIPNITFNLHMAHQVLLHVNERLYLCEHGNTIRGWAGIPWYGCDRKVANEAKRQMKRAGFDKLIIQHFHTAMNTQYFQVGGSLSGTSEFDHTQGRYSGPCQCAWMVHPKHGEFDWTAFKG